SAGARETRLEAGHSSPSSAMSRHVPFARPASAKRPGNECRPRALEAWLIRQTVGEKCATQGPRDCPNVLRIGVSPSDNGCAGTAVLLYPIRSSVVDDVEPSKCPNTRTGRKSQSGPEILC